MKDMIRQYDSEIGDVVKTGIIDPSILAAKYSHIFVNIHPFLDGNGRMSRLILNSILLKLGIPNISLGKTESACRLYKEVASSASQIEDIYDGREEEEKPVAYKELASLILKCSAYQMGKALKAAI
jgi:Fic family protein